ncbi:MAG: DUF721 domain-containing protein [Treponema sp.]|nr:DUF721 domain-containing protein [Treponema sp.]
MREDVSITAADMIMTVFQNIESAQLIESNKILSSWKTVLESITSWKNGEILKTGEKLYAHSRLVDLKNGVLLVEADHSGWIQLLHTYQNFIISGLKKNIPELEIDSMVFRLKGSDFGLKNVDYDKQMAVEKAKLKMQYKKQEEVLKKFEMPKTSGTKELPENLKKIFADMKNSMLTKNE